MNAYAIKRAVDMPLVARIAREGKGKYVVQINFAKTARHLTDEIVFAANQKQVKAHILKMYPTLKFKR